MTTASPDRPKDGRGAGIPPRPTKGQQPTIRYTDLGGMTWTPLAYFDHEHAVAKVAVEALRTIRDTEWGTVNGKPMTDDELRRFLQQIARSNLSDIEESGWTP